MEEDILKGELDRTPPDFTLEEMIAEAERQIEEEEKTRKDKTCAEIALALFGDDSLHNVRRVASCIRHVVNDGLAQQGPDRWAWDKHGKRRHTPTFILSQEGVVRLVRALRPEKEKDD